MCGGQILDTDVPPPGFVDSLPLSRETCEVLLINSLLQSAQYDALSIMFIIKITLLTALLSRDCTCFQEVFIMGELTRQAIAGSPRSWKLPLARTLMKLGPLVLWKSSMQKKSIWPKIQIRFKLNSSLFEPPNENELWLTLWM